MKEDTLNSQSSTSGKYRINARLKNKESLSDGAINAIGANENTAGEESSSPLFESASQILTVATDSAKKAYGFVNQYKYYALGAVGAVGLAGAGYMLLNKRNARQTRPQVKTAARKTARNSKKR